MEKSNISIIELLNSSALKLLSVQTLPQLSKTIVEEAKKLVGAEYGLIFLQEMDKFEKTYVSSLFLSKIKPKRKGLMEKAFHSHNITIMHNDAIHHTLPDLEKAGIKSVVIIPLSYQNASIGVLMLHSLKNEYFTNKELHILRLFGSMASLAITQTRLHDETNRALEMRDRFISLASHELRTPLTSLNGYIQLLYTKMAKKNTVESRWVEELYHESTRFTNLVKDLLNINRIKQGQLAFDLSEVNIKQVIQRAIDRFRLTNPENEIDFIVELSQGQRAVIGDSDKLGEMFCALLSNAIKFSKPNSKIFVSLTYKSRMLNIMIKDFGKGIPKKDMIGVFDGFYKTKHSKDKEGMGVGLLLAKHIVTHHKGKMSILSSENKGTTVKILLPNAKI